MWAMAAPIIEALGAEAVGAAAAEGVGAAAAEGVGAAAAEGVGAAEGGGGMGNIAKTLFRGGSNHNSPPPQRVEVVDQQKTIPGKIGAAVEQAISASAPGTDLSGSNSLYREF